MVMMIGDYNVQVLEAVTNQNDGLKFFPVLIDLFDGDTQKGHKRVYIAKTMSEHKVRELLKNNVLVVEELFLMCENQRVTLASKVEIIQHKDFPQKAVLV